MNGWAGPLSAILLAVLLAGVVVLWLSRRWKLPPATLAYGEFPVRTLLVKDWEFRYHISGRGPALLLIHGIGANLYCWRSLIPLLNSHFTVIAPDLPGFGQSSKHEGVAYGLDEQVERLRDFLRELGYKQAYVVGNSMGGNLALWFAITRPNEVRGTAVIAPATRPSLAPPVKNLTFLAKPLSRLINRHGINWAHRRTVSKGHLVDGDRVAETLRTYGGNAAALSSFLLATEVIRDPRLSQRLGEIKTPVLILWGSRDRLISRKVIDDLEAALALHESHVHIGGGHHLQEDEPEWVAAKIDAFYTKAQD